MQILINISTSCVFRIRSLKIIPHLSRTGYIRNIRGKREGIRLSKPLGLIKIGKLANETEATLEVVECCITGRIACALLPNCALKSALHGAKQYFLATFDKYTFSDLLDLLKNEGPISVSGNNSYKSVGLQTSFVLIHLNRPQRLNLL